MPRRRVLSVQEGLDLRRHLDRVSRVVWDIGLSVLVGRDWVGRESEGMEEMAARMVGVVVRRTMLGAWDFISASSFYDRVSSSV